LLRQGYTAGTRVEWIGKMVEEITRAAIRTRVEELAKGAGLRRGGLAASLGEGLRRLWSIGPDHDEQAVQKIVIPKFERMIEAIPDSSRQRFLRHSGRLCYNISPLTENRSFGYTDRQRCMDGKFRKGRKLPPISFSRSIGSVRADAEKIYDHLAVALNMDWCKFAPDEPFPLELKPDTKKANADDSTAKVKRAAPSKEETQPYVSAPIVPRNIPFVERSGYTAEFVTRFTRGDKIIPFVGEPGNGKSRLADWLIEQHRRPNDSRIDLRAHDRSSLRSDIAVLLEQRNITTLYLSDDQVIEQFGLWLCASDAPEFVFIDNLEDRHLCAHLILPAVHSRVIVTSREDVVPTDVAMPIVVRSMESEEAQQLIRQLLPAEQATDFIRLAAVLGYRPLAIVHASTGLLADGFMAVEQFCQALEDDAASVMQRTQKPEDADRTLTWIYRRILGRLRQLDRDTGASTAALLELIAFVAPVGIPADLLFYALGAYKRIKDNVSGAAVFQAAQRDLCARYLLARDGAGETATFAMHPLTQTLLRSIIASEEGKTLELCLHLHWLVQRRLKHERDDTDLWFTSSVSMETQGWLPHIYAIARGIVGAIQDGPRFARDGLQQETEFGNTLATLIRGFRDAGDPVAARRAANLHPTVRNPDEWRAAPYLFEAYIESLRLWYDLAQLDRAEYGHWLEQAFLCLPDLPNAPGKKIVPRPMQMLEYTEDVLQTGDCTEALNLIDQFDKLYPLSKTTPHAVLLYRLTLLGEIYHQQCRWPESERELANARRARAGMGLSQWQFKREDMRALVTHVENALLSGTQQEAVYYEHLADTLWTEKPAEITDSLTEARYSYLKARCAVAKFIRTDRAVKMGKIGEIGESVETIRALIDRATDQIRACVLAYDRVSSVRNIYRLEADTMTLYYLIGGKAREDARQYIEQWAETSLSQDPPIISLRLVLLNEKLKLLTTRLSVHVKAAPTARRDLEDFAELMGCGTESPYFYAEFLALSCVYDQLLGSPTQAKLKVVENAYESIGRPDRFAALQAALDQAPKDVEGYMWELSYLLLP
jgi:hypothetical protein